MSDDPDANVGVGSVVTTPTIQTDTDGVDGDHSPAAPAPFTAPWLDMRGGPRFQRLLLAALQTVDELFTAAGIPYWMTCGTLLGAVRHRGFIPHDDDIDLEIQAGDLGDTLGSSDPLPPPHACLCTRPSSPGRALARGSGIDSFRGLAVCGTRPLPIPSIHCVSRAAYTASPVPRPKQWRRVVGKEHTPPAPACRSCIGIPFAHAPPATPLHLGPAQIPEFRVCVLPFRAAWDSERIQKLCENVPEVTYYPYRRWAGLEFTQLVFWGDVKIDLFQWGATSTCFLVLPQGHPKRRLYCPLPPLPGVCLRAQKAG